MTDNHQNITQTHDLGVRLHAGQLEILNTDVAIKVLCCGRRWGKSYVAYVTCLKAAIEKELPVGYVMPTMSRCNDAMEGILKLTPEGLIDESKTKRSPGDKIITFTSGGSIRFMTAEKFDAFRGKEFHTVVIDEAAEIVDLENAWEAAISPTQLLYGDKARTLFLSSPRGKNYFYKLFELGQQGEDDIKSWRFKSEDNPLVPRDYLEKKRKKMSLAYYRQEYEAAITENQDNPFDTDAIQNNTIDKLSDNPTVVFGIDLASLRDFTVIIGLDQDGCMTHFERFQAPWEEIVNRVKSLPRNVTKVIDSTGVGDVVIGMIENEVPQIRPFKFSSSSKMPLIQQLIKDVETDRLKFNKETAEEMYVFEAKRNGKYVKYEAQAGFHDDCIMSLAMANHYLRKEHVRKDWKLYTT